MWRDVEVPACKGVIVADAHFVQFPHGPSHGGPDAAGVIPGVNEAVRGDNRFLRLVVAVELDRAPIDGGVHGCLPCAGVGVHHLQGQVYLHHGELLAVGLVLFGQECGPCSCSLALLCAHHHVGEADVCRIAVLQVYDVVGRQVLQPGLRHQAGHGVGAVRLGVRFERDHQIWAVAGVPKAGVQLFRLLQALSGAVGLVGAHPALRADLVPAVVSGDVPPVLHPALHRQPSLLPQRWQWEWLIWTRLLQAGQCQTPSLWVGFPGASYFRWRVWYCFAMEL